MPGGMEAPEQRSAIVVAGGPGPFPMSRLMDPVPEGAFVVAADSGLERAAALGLRPDLVVGDFDSVDPTVLADAEAEGVRVERHPVAKDATDLALAIDAARASGATRVLVVAGDGGRFDHTLANALLLASDDYADLAMEAVVGAARITVIRTNTELAGLPGDLVSLLAVGGPATGIVTEGLLYPLRGEDLHPGSSRGVSNEFVAARASVSVDGGVLVAVQPEGARPDGMDETTE